MPQPVRPPRPKKWIEAVVVLCTFWHSDHFEQLRDLRKEYRNKKRERGRKLADRWARNEALRWLGYTAKEAATSFFLIWPKMDD